MIPAIVRMIVCVPLSSEVNHVITPWIAGINCVCSTFAICNTTGATNQRGSDAVIYTHAGPEIGVDSTKGFLTQVAACYLLGLYLAQVRGTMFEDEIDRVRALGATEVADRRQSDGGGWMVLADPEGNEFCILRGDVEGPDHFAHLVT